MLASSASVIAAGNAAGLSSLGLGAKRASVFRKGPAPKRVSRTLSVDTQSIFGGGGKSKAVGTAYICKDCGYIETDNFEAQPKSYRCPVCNAPKRRFGVYNEPVARNANSLATRKARKAELQIGGGGSSGDGPNPAVLLGAAVVVLAALYVGLNSAL